VGWIIANWVSRRVARYLERSEKIDSTLKPIFVTGAKVLILVFTVLAVLSKFGVETTSIIALVGTIGLAIGLALQGTLSNIASGIMLLVLRPFNIGDAVDLNGTMGVVDEIGLFVTEMHSFDNIYISMPNSKVWGNKIENLTKNPTRRVDMEFGIHYDDDMQKAKSIINEIVSNDERVLAEPEPLIAVGTLADSSVNIRVRPWTQNENVWPLRYDLTQRIKERFDEENITIPFPQRDVHHFNADDVPGSQPTPSK
jgi:small conductance mechanosensitive channel